MAFFTPLEKSCSQVAYLKVVAPLGPQAMEFTRDRAYSFLQKKGYSFPKQRCLPNFFIRYISVLSKLMLQLKSVNY